MNFILTHNFFRIHRLMSVLAFVPEKNYQINKILFKIFILKNKKSLYYTITSLASLKNASFLTTSSHLQCVKYLACSSMGISAGSQSIRIPLHQKHWVWSPLPVGVTRIYRFSLDGFVNWLSLQERKFAF